MFNECNESKTRVSNPTGSAPRCTCPAVLALPGNVAPNCPVHRTAYAAFGPSDPGIPATLAQVERDHQGRLQQSHAAGVAEGIERGRREAFEEAAQAIVPIYNRVRSIPATSSLLGKTLSEVLAMPLVEAQSAIGALATVLKEDPDVL